MDQEKQCPSSPRRASPMAISVASPSSRGMSFQKKEKLEARARARVDFRVKFTNTIKGFGMVT